MLKKLGNSVFLDSWMRPPQWRWKAVMSNVAGDRSVTKLIRSDEYLRRASKFYESRKLWFKDASVYRRKYPIISAALDLYLDNKPSGWKWYIEALILTGLSDASIVSKLQIHMPKDVIRWYRHLFFDLSIYGKSEIAIDTNVFGATRAISSVYTDFDYSWKLIAYTWGADVFLKHVSPKRKVKDTQLYNWFESVVKERMLAYSFHISSDMRIMYNQQALDILTVAKSFWDVPDEALNETENSLTNSYLDDLLKRVDITMTTVRKKSIPKNEPRTSINRMAEALKT